MGFRVRSPGTEELSLVLLLPLQGILGTTFPLPRPQCPYLGNGNHNTSLFSSWDCTRRPLKDPCDSHVHGSHTPSWKLRPPKVVHLLHEPGQGPPGWPLALLPHWGGVRGGHARQGSLSCWPLIATSNSADLQLHLLLTSASICLWWEKRPPRETGLLNLSQEEPPSGLLEQVW